MGGKSLDLSRLTLLSTMCNRGTTLNFGFIQSSRLKSFPFPPPSLCFTVYYPFFYFFFFFFHQFPLLTFCFSLLPLDASRLSFSPRSTHSIPSSFYDFWFDEITIVWWILLPFHNKQVDPHSGSLHSGGDMLIIPVQHANNSKTCTNTTIIQVQMLKIKSLHDFQSWHRYQFFCKIFYAFW